MEKIRCTKCNRMWKIDNIGQHFETCKPKKPKPTPPNIIVGFVGSGKKSIGKGSKNLRKEIKRLNRVILKQKEKIEKY
jgi:hypothetical protein